MFRGDWRGKERPFHRTSNPGEETDCGPLQMPATTSLSSHFIFQTHTCPHPNLQEMSSLPSPLLKSWASLSLACPPPQLPVYLLQQCLPVSSHDNLHVPRSFSVPWSGPSTYVLMQVCGLVRLHFLPDRLLGLLNTVLNTALLIAWVTGHLGLQISWKLTFWELPPIPALAIFKRSSIFSIHSLWPASAIFRTFGAKPSSY